MDAGALDGRFRRVTGGLRWRRASVVALVSAAAFAGALVGLWTAIMGNQWQCVFSGPVRAWTGAGGLLTASLCFVGAL